MTVKTHHITWRELILQGLLLVLLLAILFPPTFLKGEIILPGGLLFEGPPWKAYAPEGFEPPNNEPAFETLIQTHYWFHLSKEILRNGDWPFWNHLQFGGMPLLANYQSAVFFPLRLLHLVMDVHVATTLFFLLRLWLCGMFCYICAREFGLSGLAAAFASLAYMVSSYNITWMYWPLPGVAAFLPLALLGSEYIVRKRYTKGFFVFVFGATMLMLAGHPETAFTGCFGLGIYFLLRLVLARRDVGPVWKPLFVISAAWVVVLSVCAAQILPLMEYIPRSHTVVPELRRVSAEHYALPLISSVLFFVPRFLGMTADNTFWLDHPENSNLVAFIYPGIVVWAAIALLTARAPWRTAQRRRVIALVACVFVLALLAFRIELLAPIHQMPLFKWIWQRYHMTFVMLALPLLGAFGIDHWLSKPRTFRDLLRPIICLAIPAVSVMALYAFYHQYLVMEGLDGYVLRQILIAGGLLGASLFALLVYTLANGRGVVLKAALCILVSADLAFAARNLLPTTPRDLMYPSTKLTNKLKEVEKPHRFSVFSAGIKPGLLQMYGVEQLWGSDGIYPARMMRFMDECHPEAWDTMEPVCAVNYYLYREESYDVSKADPRFRHIATLDGIHVMENRTAYDRAFLVPRLEVIEDVDALFKRIRSPGYNPKTVALTELQPQSPVPEASTTELGTATVTHRSANKLTAEVDAAERCFLVVSEAYYPGWHSYIDGEKAEVLPVYHAFRGVIVPEGEHTVTFRMESPVFYAGLTVSTVALVLGLLAAARVLWKGPRTLQNRPCGRKKDHKSES
ncbi:MAG: YfhO family protein [Candidatus Hydrogenedentota bacterium]